MNDRCSMLAALAVAYLSVTQGCDGSSTAERELAHTDAEVFEAVARSQLSPGPDDSTRSPGFLRIDSRPVDNVMLYSAQTPTPSGISLEEDPVKLSSETLEKITEERRVILERLGIEEGGPFLFPGCGGVRTGEPVQTQSATTSGGACPAEWRRYVTIGLPRRGIEHIPEKVRRTEPQSFDTGEIWTVVVTESSIGAGGQDWKQYAWVLTRRQERADLSLAARFLLSWAE